MVITPIWQTTRRTAVARAPMRDSRADEELRLRQVRDGAFIYMEASRNDFQVGPWFKAPARLKHFARYVGAEQAYRRAKSDYNSFIEGKSSNKARTR